MNRRNFLKTFLSLGAAVAASPAILAANSFRQAFVAVRNKNAYPGKMKRLKASEIEKTGKWAG